MSEGNALPLTLCAGVGREAVVNEDMDVFTLESGSVVLGDDCDGLCGV